ncbi:predicted protein [Postia placenta Mad-698-R]|nr:predicted protein [Postia placenta Mad-698-R]
MQPTQVQASTCDSTSSSLCGRPAKAPPTLPAAPRSHLSSAESQMPAKLKINITNNSFSDLPRAEAPAIPTPPTSTPPPLPRPSEPADLSTPVPPSPPRLRWASIETSKGPGKAPAGRSSTDSMSLPDRRRTWDERIQRLTSSSAFSSLPEPERTTIQSQLSAAEEKCTAKAEELKDALLRLAESNFWPLVEQSESKAPSSVVSEQLVAEIGSLRNTVADLKSYLGEVQRQLHAAASGDNAGCGEPSSKRRRVDHDAGSSSVVSELDSMHTRLSQFHDTLVTLESSFRAHKDHVRNEMDNVFRKRDALIEDKRAEFTQHCNKTEYEIEELAREMDALSIRTDTVNKENIRLKREVATLARQIEQLKTKQRDQIDVMQREIRELKALVAERLSASTPSTVNSPPRLESPWDPEVLFEAVRPHLIQSIRDEMRPELSIFYTRIQDILRSQGGELAAMVVPKLTMTIQAAGTIRAWAENIGVVDGDGLIDELSYP